MYPQTIEKINSLGIITINFSFDDPHRFWGTKKGGVWTGAASIASKYDLNITCGDPNDEIKYSFVGARSLYIPPGGNYERFKFSASKKKHYVTFIGQKYGDRENFISFLTSNGISVTTYGDGWVNGPVNHNEMLSIYYSSKLIIGFGYAGNNTSKTVLKGRDFEIPLTGIPYLTSYNEELANHFKEGEEMLFFRTKEEALQIIRNYENKDDELSTIGENGKLRALSDHQWQQRWLKVLNYINLELKRSLN